METHKIAIYFFSEPNYKGNCSCYWFVRKRGNKVTYSGVVNAKKYLSESAANRMVQKLQEIYPTALIKVL